MKAGDWHPDATGETPKQPKSRIRAVWGVVRSFAVGVVVLCLGWYLANWLFQFTGRPPELVVYLVAVLLGVLVAGGVANVVGRLVKWGGRQGDLGDEILDALDRIAHGDFSARVHTTPNGPLWDVVSAVNTMASELGSLEQQRQDFVSNVSHEIQSPLTSIAGFARLLRDDWERMDEATRTHYLDIIVAEAERLSKLGDNLLRLSSLDDDPVLSRHRFRLDEQLRQAVLVLEPQWVAKRLDVELNAPEVEIDADEDLLQQVWINLIHNAIKFTPQGGRIRVEAGIEGSRVRCRVCDDGIGIAPADLPHIFERFFRADKARSVGGNGLGLALAKRIVELHGGTIRAASEPGQGTEFSVDLPLTFVDVALNQR